MTKKRPKHPNDAIERAIRYAEQQGWRVVKSSGKAHAWGRLFCPRATREGCSVGVYSTPKNAENHARHIRRAVDRCDCDDLCDPGYPDTSEE